MCNTKAQKISLIVIFVILLLISILTVIYLLQSGDNVPPKMGIQSCVSAIMKIVVASMSCCAVKRESVCLIITLSVILFLSALTDICAIPGYLVVRHDSLIVNLAWPNTKAMDTLQTNNKCCGKTGPEDYTSVNKTIPASCYSNHNTTSGDVLYKVGCITQMHDAKNAMYDALFVLNCASLVFEVTGFVLTLLLCTNFRNKRRRRNI